MKLFKRAIDLVISLYFRLLGGPDGPPTRIQRWCRGIEEPECKCEKTWSFYPDMKANEVWHSDSRSEAKANRVTHGMKLVCCHECGKVHFEDYAQ